MGDGTTEAGQQERTTNGDNKRGQQKRNNKKTAAPDQPDIAVFCFHIRICFNIHVYFNTSRGRFSLTIMPRLALLHDQHRKRRMLHDIMADAAEHNFLQVADAPAADDDEVAGFLLGTLHDGRCGFTA